MSGYKLTGSVGQGGDNKYVDVFFIRGALITLIKEKYIVVKKPIDVSYQGVCDDNMIDGIKTFQVTYHTKFPPDGLIKPNDLSIQKMNEFIGKIAANKKPEWQYDGSTGWGVGGGGSVAVLSLQGALVSLTLHVIDRNNPSNKFKVKCSGGQFSAGVSRGAPVSAGIEYSGDDHPSTGGLIKRMPKGNDPLTPEDFEGAVLMEGASGQIGSAVPPYDPTNPNPNKGAFAVIKTFSRSNLPIVLALTGLGVGGAGLAGGNILTEVARHNLDRLARTKGWILGSSVAMNLDALSVEGFIAVFKSRVEFG